MAINEPIQTIKAYRIPETVQLNQFREEVIVVDHTPYSLQIPLLTPEKVTEINATVRHNRDDYLAALTTSDIINKIDLAVQKWQDPSYPLRQMAELILPKLTGYDQEMVRIELKRYMRTFRKKELLRFLDEEFDQPAMLDEFRPRKTGGMSRAYGPRSIFHVFSGNVPGVPIWSLVMGLMLKSANIGKSSLSEPLMPVLFSQSLAEVDHQLAESIAILPWKGGTEELEQPCIECADAVIVYGSNKTVDHIRQKVAPNKKILAYGHKISFAIIGQEALTANHFYETIYKLTEDIAIYDQQSCLSPQTVFVEEGGAVSAKQFAQLLAAELERYHKKRPRGKLTEAEVMSIRTVRNHYEMDALNGTNVAVYSSPNDTSWTVIFHEKPGFEGSPLNRTIHVFAVNEVENNLDLILPYQSYLQSCGIAVAPERLFKIADQLGALGVDRICSIGEMNQAKPGWHHDGGFNLLDLVHMTDIERTVEQTIERFDPDVE